MPSRPNPCAPSSTPCDIGLEGAPRLALLLAIAALLLPVMLLFSDLSGRLGAALACLALAGIALPAWLRLWWPGRQGGPRRLRWSAEGEFWLERGDGTTGRVHPSVRSVVDGPWLVLLLDGRRGRERVVIEASACDPAALASLRRALARLGAGPARSRHALRSLLQRGEAGP